MKVSLRYRLRTLCASTMLIGLLMPSITLACGVPYITISKAGPATVHAGDVVVYSITVTNHTGDSVARLMTITDTVTPGLIFVANQSTAAAFCSQSGNAVTCYGQRHECGSSSFFGSIREGGVCRGIGPGETQVYLIAFKVPDDAACGTIYSDQASLGFLMNLNGIPQNANPNPNSNVVTTTVVCQSSSSSSSSIPSSSSSSSSSSVPSSSSSSSSSSTPASSSSSSTPSASSSSAVPIVVVPGSSISNSNAFALNLSNNQNTQNVSIFNAGANISVGAPNINVNTGGANVAVNATASPSTSVVNNTQGAAQYQPQYPQYPSYPPPPPVYPAPQPPQQIIIEKPVVIPPPIIVQPLPQTGIGDFTGSVEDTSKFLSPITGSRDGGLIATAFLSFALLFGATGIAGVITKRNVF